MPTPVFRSLPLLLSALILAGGASAWAQKMPDPDAILPVQAGAPGTPRLVDAEGREVPVERLPGILAKGEWRPEPVMNADGKVIQWRLIPTTPDEKVMLLAAAKQAEERVAAEEAARRAALDADQKTVKILKTTEVLDGAGRAVTPEHFFQLAATGDWKPEQTYDAAGKLTRLQLVPTTSDEKAELLAAARTSPAARGTIRVTKDTKVLDAQGEPIEPSRFFELAGTNDWKPEHEFDADGNLVVLRLVATTAEDKAAAATQPAPTGAAARSVLPPFNAKNLEGKDVRGADYNGKIVVVSFWFTSCLPCVREMPALNDLVAWHEDETDIAFIAPALDDAPAIKEFLAERRFDFEILAGARLMAQLFNVKVYPTNFVFDKEGKEIARLDGSRPDIAEALEEAIKEARGEGAASAGKAKKKKKSKSR